MDGKRDSEQENIYTCTDKTSLTAEAPVVSRRKFTRNALVGGAVLLTLNNRSAWGATATACISTSLLTSYTLGQASRPFTPEQLDEISKYENRVGGDYTQGDQTCYDYEMDETNTGTIEIIDRTFPPAK